MNTSATLRLRGPCSSATLSGREVEGQGKRSVQAINNEHSRVAAPEGRRRAVQAIKRLIRKMPLSLVTHG